MPVIAAAVRVLAEPRVVQNRREPFAARNARDFVLAGDFSAIQQNHVEPGAIPAKTPAMFVSVIDFHEVMLSGLFGGVISIVAFGICRVVGVPARIARFAGIAGVVLAMPLAKEVVHRQYASANGSFGSSGAGALDSARFTVDSPSSPAAAPPIPVLATPAATPVAKSTPGAAPHPAHKKQHKG